MQQSSPAARAREAYFIATQQHIDGQQRWQLVARAVIEAYVESKRQVPLDLNKTAQAMARSREERGWEIYGCAIEPGPALMNAYEEALDLWNYLRAARHWKRHSALAMADELLDDLRQQENEK